MRQTCGRMIAPEGQGPAHAVCPRRLDLALGDGLDGAPEDLGGVGAEGKAQRDHAGGVGAEFDELVVPEPAGGGGEQRRGAEVDDQHHQELGQAAHYRGVGGRGGARHPVLGELGHGAGEPQHDAAAQRPEGQLQGHPRTQQQLIAEPLEVDHRLDPRRGSGRIWITVSGLNRC